MNPAVCHLMGYDPFILATRDLWYSPPKKRQIIQTMDFVEDRHVLNVCMYANEPKGLKLINNTCHKLYYTSRGALAGMRNSSMGSPWRIDLDYPSHRVRCSSVVRAFTHCAMGRRIDPSWWTHWAISRSGQCSTTCVTKAMVCVILSVGCCI